MANTKRRIRAAITKLGRADQSRRVPKCLQQRVVTYARSRVAAGGTIQEAALEVGVSGTSLRRWLAACEEQPAAAFEAVEVITDEAARGPEGLVVHGPAGLVIEGLDVPQLAELLRRLG